MTNFNSQNSSGNKPVKFDYGKALLSQNGGWLVLSGDLQLPIYSKIENVKNSRSQAWFWTTAWQKGERKVDRMIEKGEFETFDSMEDFLGSLEEIGRAHV